MLIQLFILGILSENNYHPYFIKKLFTNIVDIDPSFKLSDGKLYYHFDSLEKKDILKKSKSFIQKIVLKNPFMPLQMLDVRIW
ncbi:hypothetical protein KGI01_12690 [Kurthia gibsonii]|nr:hypothetical protein KGI01_12690 [Kurthia gibsonii]